MSSITRKFISKTLALILLAGIFHACSKSDIGGGTDSNGDGNPIQLSLALATNHDLQETRGNENPNDYNQEGKIHSLEVFIFKPTGELDGYALAVPQEITVTQAAGKYYDKEYQNIDQIKDISLTAGDRHLYVIANPPR